MDIVALGYLGFESPAAAEWAEFGPDVLGMELVEVPGDEAVYLRMDDRHHRIALRPGPVDRLAYLGWEMKHRPAFEQALETLDRHGVDVTTGDDSLRAARAVHDLAWFCDPAGYRHEIFYGQEFHPRSFRPGRLMGGFVAEELGVGHVVLAVPELGGDLRAFAEEVMGFEWFGQGVRTGAAVFYRPRLNPRSHSMAYIAVPGHVGIHHVGLEVLDVDDVGTAYDIVCDRDVPVQLTMGRHTQDPVISFYLVTPSGFVIEYLTGGAHFDGPTYHEQRPRQVSLWGHRPVTAGLPRTVAPLAG